MRDDRERIDPQRMPGGAQMVWFADLSIEKAPMMVSNWTVPEASGNFWPARRRFGAHSSNESMDPVFYKKMAFIAFFNAGVRASTSANPFSEGGRLFHPGDHREDRQALRQGRRPGPLQDGDPDQQRRRPTHAAHLHRRSRQHRMHILELGGEARTVAGLK